MWLASQPVPRSAPSLAKSSAQPHLLPLFGCRRCSVGCHGLCLLPSQAQALPLDGALADCPHFFAAGKVLGSLPS